MTCDEVGEARSSTTVTNGRHPHVFIFTSGHGTGGGALFSFSRYFIFASPLAYYGNNNYTTPVSITVCRVLRAHDVCTRARVIACCGRGAAAPDGRAAARQTRGRTLEKPMPTRTCPGAAAGVAQRLRCSPGGYAVHREIGAVVPNSRRRPGGSAQQYLLRAKPVSSGSRVPGGPDDRRPLSPPPRTAYPERCRII